MKFIILIFNYKSFYYLNKKDFIIYFLKNDEYK
jgi:hypothetical protein